MLLLSLSRPTSTFVRRRTSTFLRRLKPHSSLSSARHSLLPHVPIKCKSSPPNSLPSPSPSSTSPTTASTVKRLPMTLSTTRTPPPYDATGSPQSLLFLRLGRPKLFIWIRSIVNMRYTVFPDIVSYRLENEDDMKMMFRVLACYSSDFVDVDVCSFDVSASGSESVLSNNVSEDSSVSFDENNYLECYKPEEAKRYCSKGWENYIKSKNQKFQGGVEEFRLKLRMYAIEMGFEYNYHGVVRLQTNKMMGSKIIKSIMLDKVRENPNKKAIDIYHEIKSDYGMEVSYCTAWYGKERARKSVLGDDADSYAQLVWFGQKEVESNPGSTIKIEYEPETRRFE
ncbi:hypothetical protein ACLB2K_058768 [Fragaria x ananassa]